MGRLVAQRPAAGGRRVYRFLVDRTLKGPIGREVDVAAPLLTDSKGEPLARNVAVGVLARLDGATFTTTSCGLVEAGSLVSASEPERGTTIKIAIGLVIAALVVGYSLRRLRVRQAAAGR